LLLENRQRQRMTAIGSRTRKLKVSTVVRFRAHSFNEIRQRRGLPRHGKLAANDLALALLPSIRLLAAG